MSSGGDKAPLRYSPFLSVQWVLCTLVSAQTTIIPSLTVSERYDSNIYYAPKSTLSPGTKARGLHHDGGASDDHRPCRLANARQPYGGLDY